MLSCCHVDMLSCCHVDMSVYSLVSDAYASETSVHVFRAEF